MYIHIKKIQLQGIFGKLPILNSRATAVDYMSVQ